MNDYTTSRGGIRGKFTGKLGSVTVRGSGARELE